MTTARSIALICLAVLCAAPAAEAQRVVVGYRIPASGEAVTQIHNLTTGRVESSEAGSTIQLPLFTADGRYLTYYGPTIGAVTDPQPFRIRNLVTGVTLLVMADFDRVVAHPRETAIFGLSRATGFFGFGRTGYAARLDATGLHEFGGCAPGTANAVDVSADGAWLVALCSSGEVAVLDSSTGAVRSRVAASAVGYSIGANRDGSRALVIRAAPGGEQAVASIDTATGIELGSAMFPTPPLLSTPCVLHIAGVSPDRSLAGVTCTQSSNPMTPPSPVYVTYLLDMETPAFGQQLPLPLRPWAVTISPDNRTLFYASSGSQGISSLNIIDLPSNLPTLNFAVFPTALAVSHAPLATTASHTVTGQRVDLTWSLPIASPAVTAYTVQVGSTPGATDLRFPVGAATSLSVPAAPPGRYYVRVVGENVVGAGAASNEIVVEVP